MPPTLAEISAQARQLQDADKIALAEELLAEVETDGLSMQEIEQAWAVEVRARIQADQAKEIPSVTHEELMAQLRSQ